MAELTLKVRGDVTDLEAKLKGLEAQAVRTSKVIKTEFTSWGQSFETAGRYAEGLGRRMQFIEQQTKQATEAMRRFNIEQRGGGRIGGGGAAGGIGSQVGQAASGYVLGGGVAGATVFALSAATDFAKDSASAYVEAARGAAFLEATANRTGQSYARLRGEVDAINASFAISRNEAQTSLAQAERLASRAGLTGRGGDILRATLRSEVGAGLGPDSTSAILQGLASGDDEQYRKLFGETPNISYKRALEGTGRNVDSLSEEEKARIRLNRLLEEGNRNLGAYNKYLASAAGQTDQLAAQWEDIKRLVSESVVPLAHGMVGVTNELLPPGKYGTVTGEAGLGGGRGPVGLEAARNALFSTVGGGFAAFAERSRINAALAPGAGALSLLGTRDPLERIRIEGDIRARAIQQQYANDPALRSALVGQNAALTQAQLGSTSGDIFARLAGQLGGINARNAGRDSPIAGAIIQARTELAAFNREIQQLGPAFQSQGSQIRQALVESQRQGFVNLAETSFGNISSLSTRYASLTSHLGTNGFKLGGYGQLTDEANFTTSYGETPSERAQRAFNQADRFARLLDPTGEDTARYARRFRLEGTAGIKPEDLTADQRRQLQADLLAEIKEQGKQAKDALAAAKNSEAYLKRIADKADPPDGDEQPQIRDIIVIENRSSQTARFAGGGADETSKLFSPTFE